MELVQNIVQTLVIVYRMAQNKLKHFIFILFVLCTSDTCRKQI